MTYNTEFISKCTIRDETRIARRSYGLTRRSDDRSKMFQKILLIGSNISLNQVKSMRKKLVSIILLVILLAAPYPYALAQETDPEGGTDDPSFDPTSTGNTTDTGGVLPEGNVTDPVDDPVVESNATEIDPIIYGMVKNNAEERYAELYELIFGIPVVVDDSDTPPEIPATNATSPPGEVEGNATIPDGTVDGNATVGTGLTLNGTEVLLEIPAGYTGPMIPNGTDPALMNQFVHAWSAMESAESKTNPRAAANQYLRAMKQLSNAYRKFQKDNPFAAVGDVNETGVPLGDIPVEPTDTELSETQQELIGRFHERFQERVTQMLENYNDVEGSLSPDDAVKAMRALTKAEEKLLRIQTRIEAGEFGEVIDDLDNATDTLDGDFGSLEDDQSAQMFRTMNKLEARISKLVERSERKAAKGEDTSGLDAEVAKARGNKDKTKNDFKDDKERGNSGADNDTGKPDKDTGKPDKDNPGQGNNP